MNDPARPHVNDATEPATGDPDMGSTWSTIDGTAEVDDLLDEEDLKDFLVEPIPDPLVGTEDTNTP